MAQRCRESTFGYKEIETFPSGFTSAGLVPPCPLFLSIPAHPLLLGKTAQDFLPGAVHTFYNLTAAHMCTPSPVPLRLITRATLAWTNRRLPLPVSLPNTAPSPLSATSNSVKYYSASRTGFKHSYDKGCQSPAESLSKQPSLPRPSSDDREGQPRAADPCPRAASGTHWVCRLRPLRGLRQKFTEPQGNREPQQRCPNPWQR